MTSHIVFDYDEYARKFKRKEFWKQDKRTIEVKTVSEEDIKK